MSCIASIIIPTHNRSASLKKLLDKLHQQGFPFQNFEVVVVADGCHDNTVEMVRSFKSAFKLSLLELPGLGAASARNAGAAIASGNWFIFLDDDMEPCEEFIEQHIKAHSNDNTVVIGYSPLRLEKKASVQRMSLRHWWEDKFQEMRKQNHRFKYSDLTSGNFSISANLFKRLDGFDTSMKCREDYEFGFRLIEAGSQFQFAYKAVAFHNDEITSFHRSLLRKREEGRADVQMKNLHPHFINKQAIHYLNAHSFLKTVYLKLLWHIPSVLDVSAKAAEHTAVLLQKLKLRSSWLNLNYRLHEYWYLRGLFERLNSNDDLKEIQVGTIAVNENLVCTIDLMEGLQTAEQKIDELKPLAVIVLYKKELGTISYEGGYEQIKGIHLRKILKEQFANELYSGLKEN